VDPSVTEKVCAIRENVADLIGANRYRTWFGGTTDFRLNGEDLRITVANSFVGNWISANYMPHLVEATRRVVGEAPRVTVHVGDTPAAPPAGREPESAAPQPESATVRPAPPARRDAPPAATPPRPALRGQLDAFVVGPSNELAFSVVSSLVRSPGTSFKHLVIHGGCGLGKTHLLQGICNGVSRTHPHLAWRYISGEEFTNEFIYAVKAGRIDQFRNRFRHVDLLVIDDIHFLADKRATQEEFLHTYNAIDASGKTVVLSTDRHPRSITSLSEPLVNRLIAAMVIEINPPDFSTRREILQRRAEAMLVPLPEAVLDFLAQRITRNVRELEGALYKLAAFASLTKEALTLDLARRVVEDYVANARPPAASDIERIAAAHFGVTVDAVDSNSRDRTVTLARSVAMFLIRKHTRMSLPEIGRALGNKQHSTVLMAVRRIQTALDRRQVLVWKTPAGLRERHAQDVIDDLEQQLLKDHDGCGQDG
jgi:chromosomal replication initiator protein